MISMAQNRTNKEKPIMDPKKFNLWLAIIGSMMLFAAFTSGYIVRRAEGNWNSFPIPEQFMYSCVIVIISSITMQWAWFAARRDELFQLRVALVSTLMLGLGFAYSQFLGWQAMVNSNLYFSGDDVASSFFYAITFFHLLHVLGGLIGLVLANLKAFKLEIHKKNMRLIGMCTTYWHFLGGLWIYLYLFLFLNR